MGIVFIKFTELWVTFFRKVRNNGSKFFKPKWHVPVQKGFFIGILVLFVFVSFFFGMATSLLYILMFSFLFVKVLPIFK